MTNSNTGIERDYYASNITVSNKLAVGESTVEASTGFTSIPIPSSQSYLMAVCHTQAPNLGVGDHIKFDTLYSSSDDIQLDTTSPYITSAGASIGRFTLPINKKFKAITFQEELQVLGPITAGESQLAIEVYNVTDNIFVEQPALTVAYWDLKTHATFIPEQSSIKQYEIRIVEAHNLQDLRRVTLLIEELGYKPF